MDAEVVHFEIPLDNVERGHKFYPETFGWHVKGVPGMDYAMVQTTESDERGVPGAGGTINRGLAKRKEPVLHPVSTILGEGITRAEKAIEEHGGKIVRKKRPIGDGSMGFTAYFKESEGNIMGLYQRPEE